MDEDEGTLPHAQGAVKARKRPIWVRNQLIINAYDMSTLGSGVSSLCDCPAPFKLV